MRWDEVETFVVEEAQADLHASGDVRPLLVAFAGEHKRFLAWLRPFPSGAYHDPIIELLALAMPLEVDRLALSLGARATSLRDPIPPVTPQGDLRQRVLVVSVADGTRGEPTASSTLHPFDLDGEDVRWGASLRLGQGEGWIPRALEATVSERGRFSAPDDEIVRQVRRVVDLGHELYLGPDLGRRLGVRTEA